MGPHDSFETKLNHARLLRDEIGIRRPILVDDISGTAHHAYGLLPNMSWVIGRGGQILYKSDWTSAANVEAFVERYEAGRTRRSVAGTVGPYLTEQVEFRDLNRPAFYERLHRNGSRAYDEFKTAEEIWRRRQQS